jgi:hypothetical protein
MGTVQAVAGPPHLTQTMNDLKFSYGEMGIPDD